MNLIDLLKRHEGLRLKVYNDSLGHPTIGYGRCLDLNGISEDEANILLVNDINRVNEELKRTFDWFQELDPVRQDALINMTFNLGINKLLEFRKMLAALRDHDFEEAAEQALDSLWSKQVGKRAFELSKMIRTGAYLTKEGE